MSQVFLRRANAEIREPRMPRAVVEVEREDISAMCYGDSPRLPWSMYPSEEPRCLLDAALWSCVVNVNSV